MVKIYIYSLIDPFTNEIRYVGKTKNLEKRFRHHINNSKKRNYHSANWIKSLLIKNRKPKIEILEECTKDNWEEREKYWISYYRKTYDLTNILDGGNGGATYGRLGKKWSKEHRNNYIKSRTGLKTTVSKEGKEKRYKGLLNYYEKNKTPVYQYNIEGKFIKEWNSAVDAAYNLNLNPSNINKVCRQERKKCGNFTWSFNKKSNIPAYKKKKIKTKIVLQLDLNKNIISEYNSTLEAHKVTKIPVTNLTNCLNGYSNSSGGYLWIYKEKYNNEYSKI